MAEIKIKGLTLHQEKAAQLLATGSRISEKKIAYKVGVSVATIKDWKQDGRFKVRVLQLFDENINLDISKRYRKVSKFLQPVYKEIRDRLAEDGALENVPLKELLVMMTRLHQELRLDKNSVGSFLKAGVTEFGEEVTEDKNVDPDKGDYVSMMSNNYEDMRKQAGNKVVNIRN